MSTWNQPLWGDGNDVGTIDSRPTFPDLYIRNLMNDQGVPPNEIAPLRYIIDKLIGDGITNIFTTTKSPSQLYAPLVYLNNVPQYQNTDYTINSGTITFAKGRVGNGTVVMVRYVA